MTTPESEEFSSIRAVRPVVPSKSMRTFIRVADQLVAEGDFDFNNGFQIEPLVFAADMLHVTLFKRRVPASAENDERLAKISRYVGDQYHTVSRLTRDRPGVQQRTTTVRRLNPLRRALDDAETMHVPSKEQLLFRAGKIVSNLVDGTRHPGFELSLLIDGGPVADALTFQSDLINDAADRTNAAKVLPSNNYDRSIIPIEIPFMRAPFKSEADLDDFIELVSTTADLPVFDNGLRGVSYRAELNG
ncbi:hypothetical protein H7097_02185 [Aeromicrobium sp.]|nr:hypothetical protein [Candidatus Saccharibacteria bacterium]